MKKLIALLLMGTLATGCVSSAGLNIYTLDMTPSAEAGSPVNLAVGRLRVAEALLGKGILIKKSPTEIEYYAAATWAASLDELLAEKLATEFGPADPSAPSYVISGTLLAFEQVDTPTGADAHVKIDLGIRKEGTSHYSEPALSKIYSVRVPIESPSAGSAVNALSASVEQLARQIVADTAAL